MDQEQELNKAKSSVCHFICSGCRTVLSIPENAFANKGYSVNCEMCNRPISIRPVSVDGGMEVLELSGCQYAGKAFPTELPPPGPEDVALQNTQPLKETLGNWIADSVEGEPDLQPKEGGEEEKGSLGENLVTKWEIRRKNGETFEFETFALIRQWIEQGKITAGDEIIPSGGTQYLIEAYPGTSDLFSNTLFPTTQSRKAFSAKPAVTRLRKKRARQVFMILVVVLIAGGIASAPFALRMWKVREGKAFVDGLIVLRPSKRTVKVDPLLREAKDLLRTGTTESLPKASNLLLRVLALRPTDPEILSSLAEAWTEIGALTSESAEFERAHTLISYAQALNKKHPAPRRAEIRWIWRNGNTDKALSALEEQDDLSLDSQLLFAKIAMSTSDYTNATIALSDALRQDPNNLPLLMGLVDVFEKQKKYPEAASYLRRAESLAPNPDPYREKLKKLYRKAGDKDALETLFRKSVASRSTTAELDHFELIKLFSSQDRLEEVIQESLNYFADYPEGQYDPDIRKLYEAALAGKKTANVKKRRKRRRPARSRGLRRSK